MKVLTFSLRFGPKVLRLRGRETLRRAQAHRREERGEAIVFELEAELAHKLAETVPVSYLRPTQVDDALGGPTR